MDFIIGEQYILLKDKADWAAGSIIQIINIEENNILYKVINETQIREDAIKLNLIDTYMAKLGSFNESFSWRLLGKPKKPRISLLDID